MEELEIYEQINIYGLLIGLIFGIIAQKTQFCFSGSIKDYILTKSTKRASSIIMAMIVAIVSTQIVSSIYSIDLSNTIYYKDNINYFSIIFGGIIFGIGIMYSDGCSSRHLIKFSQGDKYSLVTILFISLFAYFSTKGFLHKIISFITNNEYLLYYSSFITNIKLNIYIIVILLVLILFILVKKLKRLVYLYDGVIIGLLISIAWYITSIIGEQSIEKIIDLASITFVYPSANTLDYLLYFQVKELSFAITTIFGVLLGSFLMSHLNKKYKFGCTSTLKTTKLKNSMLGGSLMGIGGVLTIGCTVGQGLTGFSTLALASFISIISILSSAYITAIYLNKQNRLPMCFIFEWHDEKNN